ncbi:MAG: hypothetical protein AB1705_27785, partial [Verrucomicrobiota bacterium]
MRRELLRFKNPVNGRRGVTKLMCFVAGKVLDYSFWCGRPKALIPRLEHFAEWGISPGKVCEQLQLLVAANIIEIVDAKRGVYAFNPWPQTWQADAYFTWTPKLIRLHEWLCGLNPDDPKCGNAADLDEQWRQLILSQQDGRPLVEGPEGLTDAARAAALQKFQPIHGPQTGTGCPGQAEPDAA